MVIDQDIIFLLNIKNIFKYNIILSEKFSLEIKEKNLFLPKKAKEEEKNLFLIKTLVFLFFKEYEKKGWVKTKLETKNLVSSVTYMLIQELNIDINITKEINTEELCNENIEKNLDLIFSLYKVITKKLRKIVIEKMHE